MFPCKQWSIHTMNNVKTNDLTSFIATHRQLYNHRVSSISQIHKMTEYFIDWFAFFRSGNWGRFLYYTRYIVRFHQFIGVWLQHREKKIKWYGTDLEVSKSDTSKCEKKRVHNIRKEIFFCKRDELFSFIESTKCHYFSRLQTFFSRFSPPNHRLFSNRA